MIQEYANRLVDCDPMSVARRTLDTRRYIHMIWNQSYAEPIDDAQLNLFLCDEHYGNLTDEQKAVARQGRDEMRDVYGTALFRMMLAVRGNAAPQHGGGRQYLPQRVLPGRR